MSNMVGCHCLSITLRHLIKWPIVKLSHPKPVHIRLLPRSQVTAYLYSPKVTLQIQQTEKKFIKEVASHQKVDACAHDLKINKKKLKQYNQHAVLTHNSAFIIRVLTHSPLDLFFRFIGIRRYKKQQKKKTNTYNRHSSTYIVL